MDNIINQQAMDDDELPDDIIADLNQLNQQYQQQEQQHHQQQLQQQHPWHAQQPHYGQQQQQRQQQQQSRGQHLEPEDEQQQLTESRMLGHNPEIWLFPKSLSSEPATVSDMGPQDNLPILYDCNNECLPNHIIPDLPEYFPSGGLEAPEDISMEVDPIEAVNSLMSVEQRDSLKEARNIFNGIDGTNNQNPLRVCEASVGNMIVQQAGYRQYLQQQAQQQLPQVYEHPARHPAPQPASQSSATMQHRILFQGAAATTGVIMIGGANIEDQNVPPTIVGKETRYYWWLLPPSKELFLNNHIEEQQEKKPPRQKLRKKGQKARQKRRPSNMTDECSSKSVPGQRSPYHELRVQVHYRDNLKIEQTIHNPKGGNLYYKSINKGIDVSGVEKIELSLLDTNVIPGVTTLQQTKYTNNNIVNFTENGVYLYANECGIYDSRFCRGKVNFWSTECGETEMDTTIPLPRNVIQLIFNYDNFKQKVQRYYKAKRGETVPIPWYPAVVLTFSQHWSIDRSPLSSILVSAIVEPVLAQQFLDGLFVSEEVKPSFKRVQNGLHSGIFDPPSMTHSVIDGNGTEQVFVA